MELFAGTELRLRVWLGSCRGPFWSRRHSEFYCAHLACFARIESFHVSLASFLCLSFSFFVCSQLYLLFEIIICGRFVSVLQSVYVVSWLKKPSLFDFCVLGGAAFLYLLLVGVPFLLLPFAGGAAFSSSHGWRRRHHRPKERGESTPTPKEEGRGTNPMVEAERITTSRRGGRHHHSKRRGCKHHHSNGRWERSGKGTTHPSTHSKNKPNSPHPWLSPLLPAGTTYVYVNCRCTVDLTTSVILHVCRVSALNMCGPR